MKKSKVLLIAFSIGLVGLLVLAFTPSGIETHQNQKLIHAPKERVWPVISDIGNYHKYATGLTDVKILSGKGEGLVRSCSDDNGTWTETMTQWDEGKAYSFNVNTESGFPFPFDVFKGTWAIEEGDTDSTLLIVSFDYRFKYRWMSWFFGDDTHKAIDDGNAKLMANWINKIMEK